MKDYVIEQIGKLEKIIAYSEARGENYDFVKGKLSAYKEMLSILESGTAGNNIAAELEKAYKDLKQQK